jgi:Uri superfamily endonuclease
LKGIYVLIIQLNKDITVSVGALGKLTLKQGLYAYVGSAQINLEKRIERHFRKNKRVFWHIDYLMDNEAVDVEKVFYKRAGKAKECEIAGEIKRRAEPIRGFGCSDCDCTSHLFRMSGGYGFLEKMQALNLDRLVV